MSTRRQLLHAALSASCLAVSMTWSGGTFAGSTSSGEVIAVIVNKANPAAELGQNELRSIFQTTRKAWASGEDAVPINLPEDNALRTEFDHAVLGLDPDRVARYWTDRKVRGGARPPVRVPTTAAVLRTVASKSGAVGYVRLGEVNSSVKVVAKISHGKLVPP